MLMRHIVALDDMFLYPLREWLYSSCLFRNSNLTRQMVCYMKPSEKLSLKIVWKWTGTFFFLGYFCLYLIGDGIEADKG